MFVTNYYVPAAFVADIYTTAVQQGPSLPQANRSALTQQYTSNQTLFVARQLGALDTVRLPSVIVTQDLTSLVKGSSLFTNYYKLFKVGAVANAGRPTLCGLHFEVLATLEGILLHQEL